MTTTLVTGGTGTVGAAVVRRFVEAKRREKLAPGTIHIMVSELSAAYEDLLERKLATTNPARGVVTSGPP